MGNQFRNRTALLGGALATALFLAACSGEGSPEEAPEESAETNPQATAAALIVDEALAPLDEFTPPGPEFDAADLEGEEIHYIVPVAEAQIFQLMKEQLDEAFGAVGASVHMCAGTGGSADSSANCLNQAVDAGAAAVITVAIPTELAPIAFQNVTDAGIPLLNVLTTPTGPGDPTEVAYLTPDMIELESWLTNWVIADSNAQAEVLVGNLLDNKVLQLWTAEGIVGVYDSGCDSCVVDVMDISASTTDKVTSDVTAFFVSNPSTGYIQTPTDIGNAPAIQGLLATGKTPDQVKVAHLDGSLSTLTAISQNQWSAATAGWDPRALAWYSADQVLRMLSGQPAIDNPDFPFKRLFTEANIGDLELTQDAYASGEWYGTADFVSGFQSLWGLE
jgi:ribose transport system substrate-binding protein